MSLFCLVRLLIGHDSIVCVYILASSLGLGSASNVKNGHLLSTSWLPTKLLAGDNDWLVNITIGEEST